MILISMHANHLTEILSEFVAGFLNFTWNCGRLFSKTIGPLVWNVLNKLVLTLD
jgi:hypothetical protein